MYEDDNRKEPASRAISLGGSVKAERPLILRLLDEEGVLLERLHDELGRLQEKINVVSVPVPTGDSSGEPDRPRTSYVSNCIVENTDRIRRAIERVTDMNNTLEL